MKLLLDTSIIIDFLRRKDKENSTYTKIVLKKFELFISIITLAELYSGKSVWEDRELSNATESICEGATVLPLTDYLAKKAGKVRAFNSSELNDAIIAVTAMEYNLELVTLNEKDFKRIPNIKLFKEHHLKN